jgi:hypothetical protein
VDKQSFIYSLLLFQEKTHTFFKFIIYSEFFKTFNDGS